jgi:hypothetical protein
LRPGLVAKPDGVLPELGAGEFDAFAGVRQEFDYARRGIMGA